MVSEPLTDVMTIHGRGLCPKCHESLWVADCSLMVCLILIVKIL